MKPAIAASLFPLVLGLTVCADCRGADAEVTVDAGERWGRHVCLDCCEEMLERDRAKAVSPAVLDVIDRARANPRWRPLPVLPFDWETADHSKVEALRRGWRAFQASLTEATRCWAILRDGSRCVRGESFEGVCDTHHALGCRVPGLGWVGGVPQGPILARRGRSAA